MAEAPSRIDVEVAVAWPDHQHIVALEVAEGTTLRQAVEASGLLERFPEIELRDDHVGIFGELRQPDTALADGDRVEIYRPLKIEPREARRLAAEGRNAAGRRRKQK